MFLRSCKCRPPRLPVRVSSFHRRAAAVGYPSPSTASSCIWISDESLRRSFDSFVRGISHTRQLRQNGLTAEPIADPLPPPSLESQRSEEIPPRNHEFLRNYVSRKGLMRESSDASSQSFAEFEKLFVTGDRSHRFMLNEYWKVKQKHPTARLKRSITEAWTKALLLQGLYRPAIRLWEFEDIVALEALEIFRKASAELTPEQNFAWGSGFARACRVMGRKRIAGLVDELMDKDRYRKSGQLRDEGTRTLVLQTDGLSELKEVVLGLADTRVPVLRATSTAIFDRLIDMGALDEAVKMALDPLINVPGTDNIALVCELATDRGRGELGQQLVEEALKISNCGTFLALSEKDLLAGVELSISAKHLMGLWTKLMQAPNLVLCDLSTKVIQKFINAALEIGIGRKTEEGNVKGPSDMLHLCTDAAYWALQNNVELPLKSICNLVVAWIRIGDEMHDPKDHSHRDIRRDAYNKKKRKYGDSYGLPGAVPFLGSFLSKMPEHILDGVIETTLKAYPLYWNDLSDTPALQYKTLWSFIASLSRTSFWHMKDGAAMEMMEDLASIPQSNCIDRFLASRKDRQIARYAIRRNEMLSLPQFSSYKDAMMERVPNKAKRDMDFWQIPFQVVAPAVLRRSVLADMVYCLYISQRDSDILTAMTLIKGKSRQRPEFQLILRDIALNHPEEALEHIMWFYTMDRTLIDHLINNSWSTHPINAMRAYRYLRDYIKAQFLGPPRELLRNIIASLEKTPEVDIRHRIRLCRYVIKEMKGYLLYNDTCISEATRTLYSLEKSARRQQVQYGGYRPPTLISQSTPMLPVSSPKDLDPLGQWQLESARRRRVLRRISLRIDEARERFEEEERKNESARTGIIDERERHRRLQQSRYTKELRKKMGLHKRPWTEEDVERRARQREMTELWKSEHREKMERLKQLQRYTNQWRKWKDRKEGWANALLGIVETGKTGRQYRARWGPGVHHATRVVKQRREAAEEREPGPKEIKVLEAVAVTVEKLPDMEKVEGNNNGDSVEGEGEVKAVVLV